MQTKQSPEPAFVIKDAEEHSWSRTTHPCSFFRPALGLAVALATICIQLASAAPATNAPTATTGTEERLFQVTNPDWSLSPFTGLTRQGWIDCGKFILAGAFQYVNRVEDPMLFPKVPGVSYPQDGYDKCSPQQRSAAIFEGVARTFNVASPLLAEDPNLTLHGVRVADYYKYQLLQLTDPKCPYFIGYGDKNAGPEQQTCELGNLAMWMLLEPDVLWNRLNKPEQDQVAHIMQGWAKGWTKTHNWRWFDVMMMTFLKKNGYAIDDQLMLNHLDHLLMLESGEGWFRDQSHDYYTAHVYQLYGSVWNRVYSWEHEPGRAAVIDQEFNRFMSNYPAIFSREGHVNMWGRSILYRMGASATLPAAFVRGRDPHIDPGFARRLASGALLQFVTHPGFFQNGVPSLGFYGHFEPALQAYSCAASPFWMFMNYTALTLRKDDPFWTAKENDGFWTALGPNARTTFLPGAGMLLVNYGLTGTSEIVNGKVHNADPDYCRLAYNTDFPWEANSRAGATAADITLQPLESQKAPQFPETVNLAGYRAGVLYRQAIFAKDENGGAPCFVDLADIVIPDGRICIRRFRKVSPAILYEGHYGLPHVGGAPKITERTVDGKPAIIASIPGRQLALVDYSGWDRPGTVEHQGVNPEAADSMLLFVSREDQARYGAPELLISVMLHKTDDAPWTDDKLQPIQKIEPLEKGIPETLGGLRLTLKSGQSYVVDFTGIDGSSSK